MKLLPLAPEPFIAPTDRDMLPSERREFVRTREMQARHFATIGRDDLKADRQPFTAESGWSRRASRYSEIASSVRPRRWNTVPIVP